MHLHNAWTLLAKVSKLTTFTHYQPTAEHQSRNHFYIYVHIFYFEYVLLFVIHDDLQLETKETHITQSLQKKGWANMHFYYKKQFNYFVYKKEKKKINNKTTETVAGLWH